MQEVRHHSNGALAAHRNTGSGSISLVIDVLFIFPSQYFALSLYYSILPGGWYPRYDLPLQVARTSIIWPKQSNSLFTQVFSHATY